MDDAEVLVRVLGPVEIVGPPPFQRAKAAELVVYLALHRGAAIGGDRLMEALWPARPPSSSNLNLNTSVARKALGRAVDGELHLPHVGSDRTYRLGQSVGVDYELFVGLVEQARLEEPDAARQSLRSALELVRGRPFDVVGRGYEWAHVEGIVTHLEAAVADAAHALAQLEIATGDAQGARWAAQQGLRASPGNEQLYRDQMYAANLNGNRAGVVAVMDELSHVLDDEDDDLLTQLHPETVSVYRELTGAGERAS